jgi:hypothetical protein
MGEGSKVRTHQDSLRRVPHQLEEIHGIFADEVGVAVGWGLGSHC